MLYLLDCLILSDFFVVTSNSRQFTLLIAVQALSKIRTAKASSFA